VTGGDEAAVCDGHAERARPQSSRPTELTPEGPAEARTSPVASPIASRGPFAASADTCACTRTTVSFVVQMHKSVTLAHCGALPIVHVIMLTMDALTPARAHASALLKRTRVCCLHTAVPLIEATRCVGCFQLYTM
jgi:hypothetical protein